MSEQMSGFFTAHNGENYVLCPMDEDRVICEFSTEQDAMLVLAAVNALAGIPDPAAFVKRAKAIEDAVIRALADNESGSGWGPDVTVCGYLRAALAQPGGFDDGKAVRA